VKFHETVAGFQEQRSRRAYVQGAPFEDPPGASDADVPSKGQAQGPPVVEDGREVVDASQLRVEVSEYAADEVDGVRVASELGAEGGDLAVGYAEVFGVEVGVEADAEDGVVQAGCPVGSLLRGYRRSCARPALRAGRWAT